MNAKKLIAAIVLIDFAALNAYALYAEGLTGLVDFVTGLGPWGWVAAADVVIALSMVLVWMWSDARAKGRNPLGYTLLTLATGSLGTLLYVVAASDEAHESRSSIRDRELAPS